jgi:Protein of unknown function (DUF3105)
MGRNHVPRPQPITYAFCPPTSGSHYNDAGAPLKPAVYPADHEQTPGNFIHNLEHGYVVVAYRCPSGKLGEGDCISEAEFAQLQAWFDGAPAPTKSQCATKALVVRFDSMDSRFAILAWNRALLADQFDLPTALTFAQQWMEHDAVPEPSVC